MPKIYEILDEIEQFAPKRWAYAFDNVGLLIGREDSEISDVVVALDATIPLVDFALQNNAKLIITHHPVLFRGTKSVTEQDEDGRFILACLENGIALIAAHTNWDAAPGGINDTLCEVLEIRNPRAIGTGATVPPEQPCARIGTLDEPIMLFQFAEFVQERLSYPVTAWGEPDKTIQTVAVCGGAADDEWAAAHAEGADLFISGEVKQHVAREATSGGMGIFAAGHYATENPGMKAFAELLADRLPALNVHFFEPNPGMAGKPITIF